MLVPLEACGDAYCLPPPPRRKRVKRPAGDLILFGDPGGHRHLRPWLRVHSANLSDEHFRLLLADLGALIVGVSCFLAPSAPPPADRTATTSDAFDQALQPLVEAIELALATLPRYLRRVRSRPAHALIRRTRTVRADQALRHGSAARNARLPDWQNRTRAEVLEYSTDTTEHDFVSAVVGALVDHAMALAALLDSKRAQAEVRRAEQRRIQPALQRFGVSIPGPGGTMALDAAASERLRTLSSGLKRLWPRDANRSALRHRSNILELSREYGPILRVWNRARATAVRAQANARLLGHLNPVSRSIDETVVLYERWVLVKFYSALVERGFRPPAGEASLLERLKVEDGQLTVHGHQFMLCKPLEGDQVLVRLDCDRPVDVEAKTLRPDLLIECTFRGRRSVWVFDAKYKDYARPAPEYQRDDERRYGGHFEADLYGVAESKYRSKMAAEVGGILHPDSRRAHQFWDAVPVTPAARQRRPNRYPHELISMCLLPGADGESNMTKLLRLLFGFHMGLRNICWRCGEAGTPTKAEKTRGAAYTCGTCMSFWIDHWCLANRQHRLLKFGADSFHQVDDADDFNVVCPWCGRSL